MKLIDGVIFAATSDDWENHTYEHGPNKGQAVQRKKRKSGKGWHYREIVQKTEDDLTRMVRLSKWDDFLDQNALADAYEERGMMPESQAHRALAYMPPVKDLHEQVVHEPAFDQMFAEYAFRMSPELKNLHEQAISLWPDQVYPRWFDGQSNDIFSTQHGAPGGVRNGVEECFHGNAQRIYQQITSDRNLGGPFAAVGPSGLRLARDYCNQVGRRDLAEKLHQHAINAAVRVFRTQQERQNA